MMTAIVQEAPQMAPPARIPPHVLIVGKKHAVDYIAPALFRLGSFGELLVRAKGSLSIVTAVNVAEMVKKDIEDLQTRSINIGTEEFQFEGMTRRVSYIEIHLAKQLPVVPVVETPIVPAEPAVHEEVEAPIEAPAVIEASAIEVPVIEAPATPVPAETTEAPIAAPVKKARAARKKSAAKKPAAKKAKKKSA